MTRSPTGINAIGSEGAKLALTRALPPDSGRNPGISRVMLDGMTRTTIKVPKATRDRPHRLAAADGVTLLTDRYRTTRLLTLDQRHFRRLRPLWGADHFTLLPYDL